MRRLINILLLIAGAFILCMFMLSVASAQTPPIKISLAASKSSYQVDEPIGMQVMVSNESGNQVIAQEGFFNQHFYLRITFIDPDGNPVYTKYQDVGLEGGPPLRFQDKDAILVETIQSGAVEQDIMDDARTFYDITKSGRWRAQVVAYLETYSRATPDPDTGKLFAYLEDLSGAYAIKSNETSFDILSSSPSVWSPVKVTVQRHIVGTGTKPPVSKELLPGVEVRLYTRAALAQYEPVNWKVYSLIWNDNSLNPAPQRRTTGADGIATFEHVDKNDYILMTSYNDVFAGSPIDSADTDWGSQTFMKYLTFMEKADKSKVPGKTTVQKGSLLLITEPEYIEWDSTQELYPFVFETIGDWGITAAIAPPEGFITDYQSLSASVKNETEAIQFLVTDIGSRWVETNVTLTITNKNKKKVQTKTVRDKVGIRLAKKLAKEKGLDIYGETGGPGVFSGGKKVGQ